MVARYDVRPSASSAVRSIIPRQPAVDEAHRSIALWAAVRRVVREELSITPSYGPNRASGYSVVSLPS